MKQLKWQWASLATSLPKAPSAPHPRGVGASASWPPRLISADQRFSGAAGHLLVRKCRFPRKLSVEVMRLSNRRGRNESNWNEQPVARLTGLLRGVTTLTARMSRACHKSEAWRRCGRSALGADPTLRRWFWRGRCEVCWRFLWLLRWPAARRPVSPSHSHPLTQMPAEVTRACAHCHLSCFKR